ncbi:flagellar biosynthetic protein FliO [Roseibium aggregatum]|uniref:Flagellar biosynthetic protein FliO n=1 Tax=Roseibium aggregatum TaxID=187304 RepID=A0A939EDY8_9HYPH|nr:flagellar biosynthetic protein FliO [Roseibium aggregatum]MBN9671390.1 flagellar biosynthetic protein FliO [Roseibium aggregatum]
MNEWIESTFNVSGGVTQAVAVILALAVVLLLFGLFIFILKRLMGGGAPQSRGRQPRIALMDSATVDARRRLVLVRRDNVEHLLLIGGPSDVVVEQNIVRNAPLSTGRPAVHQAPAQNAFQAASPSLKVPTAPGPDIPLAPTDRAPDPEPSAPVVPAPARTAGAAAAPVMPTARFDAPPAVKTFSAPSAAPEPTIDRDDLKAVKPSRSGPLSAATPETAAPPLKLPENQTENPPEKLAAKPSQSMEKPAAGTPEPAPKKEPTIESANPSLSTIRSLARSFTSHDRPNYGSQTITPPASGPAARAKTALLKPLDPARVSERTEPVVEDTPAGKNAETDPGAGKPAETKSTTPVSTPDEAPISAIHKAQGGVPEKTAAETGEASDITEPKAAGQQTGDAPAVADADADRPEAPTSENADAKTSTGSSPASLVELLAEKATDAPPSATAGNASGPEVSLDLSDLLEDTPSAPAAPELMAPQPDAQAEETSKQTQEQAQVRAPQQVAGETKAPEVKVSPPIGHPGQRSSQGLGDKNPIEDEMAKILDELGGRPG